MNDPMASTPADTFAAPAPVTEFASPSAPAAAYAAPDSAIENVAPSPAGRRRAKTVQELILEAEMQAFRHEADVKAALSLQRLH